MTNASDFLSSNFLNAASLQPGVVIETTIVSVRPHEFEGGETKLVLYTEHQAKGVVCNQTRLKAMIEAFGLNFDTWVGKMIRIYLGETTYQGRKVGSVEIEPVSPIRLRAESRPMLRGIETPPAPRDYDGPNDGGGDIPF
jgi:hypothetical protein